MTQPEESAKSQADFHFRIGRHFKKPIIPKVYLSVVHNLGWQNKYFMILMEDIDWGVTEGVEDGLTIERLLPVIDDLAEFHAYQMGNKIDTSFMKTA